MNLETESMDFYADTNLLEMIDLPPLWFECQDGENEINFTGHDLELSQDENLWKHLDKVAKENQKPPREQKFLDWYKMRRKMAEENDDGKTIIDLGSAAKRRYQCKKCGNRYSHKRTINHHIEKICDRPASFACNLCPYRGKRKYQLTSHLQHFHRNADSATCI